MNIYWVIAEEIQDDIIDPEFISTVASSWGSYKTWQAYKTDNCISNELANTNELLQRGFETVCNLWIPEAQFSELGRPGGVHLFGGTFNREDNQYNTNVVSMHLACSSADIVLMLGFDMSEIDSSEDNALIDRKNYYLNMSRFFKEHPEVQFVLVNNINGISKMFEDIPNLSSDSADAVKEMLI